MTDYHARFRERFVPSIFGAPEEGDTLTAKTTDLLAFIDEERMAAYLQGKYDERTSLIEKYGHFTNPATGRPLSFYVLPHTQHGASSPPTQSGISEELDNSPQKEALDRAYNAIRDNIDLSKHTPVYFQEETECCEKCSVESKTPRLCYGCLCHKPRKDHECCWNQNYPKDTHPTGTACGLRVESHIGCCLCGKDRPRTEGQKVMVRAERGANGEEFLHIRPGSETDKPFPFDAIMKAIPAVAARFEETEKEGDSFSGRDEASCSYGCCKSPQDKCRRGKAGCNCVYHDCCHCPDCLEPTDFKSHNCPKETTTPQRCDCNVPIEEKLKGLIRKHLSPEKTNTPSTLQEYTKDGRLVIPKPAPSEEDIVLVTPQSREQGGECEHLFERHSTRGMLCRYCGASEKTNQ